MARNRVIYQSEALYVSEDINSTTKAKHEQLERVQSANYSFTINRQDINQYGQLARIDSIVLDPPTASLDFSYYLTDGFNERALGFYVQTGSASAGQFASGHMVNNSGKNFFISTVAEGSDAIDVEGNNIASVIGLGNGFLSDYTLDLAVGSLPTVSVTMECANITADTNLSGNATDISGVNNPAVSLTDGTPKSGELCVLPVASTGESDITALRPGDVTIDIATLDGLTLTDIDGTGTTDSIHIQSASLSIPLSRSELQRLGTRFPYSRSVDFPVNATLSVNGIVNEVTEANLATIIDDNSTKTVTLTIKDTARANRMVYTLKGCKIDSESFSSSIGSNKTVDLTISTQIGGIGDTDNGVFVSGANQDDIFS
jgi:hypothetical protein